EHGGLRRTTGIVREASSVRQAILREAAHHDLVVMGASANPTNAAPDGRYLFGTLADTVASRAKTTVIVVKTRQQVGLATFEELGVPVVRHSEVLPELGSFTGKGEALWKSLHVLDGDIVAWIDTDISNIQPRFIYGLLGPLLREPRIAYVKGFYQRPIRDGDRVMPEGGGRVTELMARPLLNLFFPELSGLVQPLAGEYAGRRELLESVPFFSGYAVELGLLVDILDHAGLSAIGQVDLERRIHRNQPLPNLSQMAFVILQATMRKLEERHRLELL